MASLKTAFALVVLSLFVLTGCGTTKLHKRYDVTQIEEWQEDYEAKRTSVIDASIKSGTLYLGDGQFVMELEQRYQVQKILYNQPRYYSRSSKEPNLFYILNPLLWITCLDTPSNCVGREGEWGGPYNDGDREFVRVQDQDTRTGPLSYPAAKLRVEVVATSATGEWRETLEPEIARGRASIDVKETLQKSPFEPKAVRILAALQAGEASSSLESRYDQSVMERLGLFSERWLSKPELYARYVHQIRSCMNDSDYKCAVKHFFKIQDLKIEVPDTFYFHFAKALSLMGDTENARKAARMYLQDARHMAYASDAEAFL
ncbi:hypothetical protein KUV59_09140 [Marinobacter daepoensis]|uniref:hypothetical protein n=1 Tax=Marinobacter daepoensis TaxID=262077 RepID=UPI001C9526FC|nr:hypothetical protein [Marinobacter daepoensis]MBY6033332.1 hypothetical protein [Marinobacter daepoensis]